MNLAEELTSIALTVTLALNRALPFYEKHLGLEKKWKSFIYALYKASTQHFLILFPIIVTIAVKFQNNDHRRTIASTKQQPVRIM
jgi:hypothetical protein